MLLRQAGVPPVPAPHRRDDGARLRTRCYSVPRDSVKAVVHAVGARAGPGNYDRETFAGFMGSWHRDTGPELQRVAADAEKYLA